MKTPEHLSVRFAASLLLLCAAMSGMAQNKWVKCTELSDFVEGNCYLLTTAEPSDGQFYYVPASSVSIASGAFSKAGGLGTRSTADPLSLSPTEAGWLLVKTSKAGQYRLQSYTDDSTGKYLYITNDNNGVAIDNASKASSYWTIAQDGDSPLFKFTYNLKLKRDLCPYLTSPYGFRSYAYSAENEYSTHYLAVYQWTAGEVSTKTQTALQWSASAAVAVLGEVPTLPTLTVQPEGLTGVVFSSSNPSVATIDPQTGRVEVRSEGTTTLTATFAETDTFYGSSASYTLVVKSQQPGGEVADGYLHDLLTVESTGVTSSSYTAFSDIQAPGGSTAVYAGRVANNATANCFQLNKEPQNNILTTASGGCLRRVTVTWASYMTADEDGRSLAVYGSHTPYSAKTTKVSGTLLGQLTYHVGEPSASLDVTDQYEYILIVASAAIYFDQLDLAWATPVTVRTQLTAGHYGTLCLPSAVAKGDYTGAEFYAVAGTTLTPSGQVDGLVLLPVDSLRAATPYIYKATDTAIRVFYSGSPATAPAQSYGLVGNLSSQKQAVPSDGHCYILYNNVVHRAYNATATIAPGRAYIDLQGVQPYTGTHSRALRLGVK
ncbi:MAG: Ig-like domain-containing protein [Bacteroidaceae bacterium]|nr:Ig-like domain-containing protein [Bacteroidaceae bacterium]